MITPDAIRFAYAYLVRPTRASLIVLQARWDHAVALKAAVGPLKAARDAEARIREHLTPEENRRRTAAQSRAMWAHQRYVGHNLGIQATKLTRIVADQSAEVRPTSVRPVVLSNAECLPILADMVETAKAMTYQEMAWCGRHGQAEAVQVLRGCENPADLLRWAPVKAAKGAARGAGTGRPRKVRPGTVADAARILAAHAPVAPGPRERAVDERVGNLPVRVDGCTCGGYRFNASIPCTGHGFGRRADVTWSHPMATGQTADRRY